MSNSKQNKILILMSGSIACYKVCSLISQLVKAGYQVKVAASHSALKFIGEATLEGLTGQKTYSDIFEPGSAMEHIHLERWADLILAAPASAHFINRCAVGVGDDLLTTIFLAHQFTKPFLVAPAMNTAMYLNPATQKSISTLKSYGVEILEAASGVLACGETGYGRLLEPDQLLADIEKRLKSSGKPIQGPLGLTDVNTDPNSITTVTTHPLELPLSSRADKIPKVLVTAGGTREPLDEVRFLTNRSTGQTGMKLASNLAQCGFNVTLDLAQSSSLTPETFYELHRFDDFNSLEDLLRRQLAQTSYDWIFHTAAVSDFSVEKQIGKISSDQDLTLKLKRNPKIINQLKEWSCNKNIKLVGFKLTSQLSPLEIQEKIKALVAGSQADYVVHNDTKTLMDRNQHQFHIYTSSEFQQNTSGVNGLVQYFSEKIGELK